MSDIGPETHPVAETEHHDLDETRRLLYMVLLGGLATERWFNLGGTLVNALGHHSKLVDPQEALVQVRAMHNQGVLSDDAEAWVHNLIDQVNEQLGD